MGDEDKLQKKRKDSERTSAQMDNVFEALLPTTKEASGSSQSVVTLSDTDKGSVARSTASTTSTIRRKLAQAELEEKEKIIQLRRKRRLLELEELRDEAELLESKRKLRLAEEEDDSDESEDDRAKGHIPGCLLYTSDAADDLTRVDLGGR